MVLEKPYWKDEIDRCQFSNLLHSSRQRSRKQHARMALGVRSLYKPINPIPTFLNIRMRWYWPWVVGQSQANTAPPRS